MLQIEGVEEHLVFGVLSLLGQLQADLPHVLQCLPGSHLGRADLRAEIVGAG